VRIRVLVLEEPHVNARPEQSRYVLLQPGIWAAQPHNCRLARLLDKGAYGLIVTWHRHLKIADVPHPSHHDMQFFGRPEVDLTKSVSIHVFPHSAASCRPLNAPGPSSGPWMLLCAFSYQADAFRSACSSLVRPGRDTDFTMTSPAAFILAKLA
jgi:hypothetical protein